LQYFTTTAAAYINAIPEERRPFIQKLREIVKSNLPKGFEEEMNYGMLGFVVPKSIYPKGYHCPPYPALGMISIASQKNFIGFYHMGLYMHKELMEWFVGEYPKHTKSKIDMGKSCVRFKKMDDIPYDLIAELCTKISVETYIERYEKALASHKKK
jgi:uncharacterized protein YdhG (YjbR/CyaY superfamily)